MVQVGIIHGVVTSPLKALWVAYGCGQIGVGQQGLHRSAVVLQWMEKWLLQVQQVPSALEVTLALEVTYAQLVVSALEVLQAILV